MLQKFKKLLAQKFHTNTSARDRFVNSELAKIPAGATLLDAGAGDQPHRHAAKHLIYTSQDFGSFKEDDYSYAPIDIVGDVWDINVKDESFDAVLCTEVLEHIPYPVETIRELSRVLRPGGILILTAPSHYRRHFDPYFFSAGFSDRWYEEVLPRYGLEVTFLEATGDFYSWMKVEIYRVIVQHKAAAVLLLPSLLFFSLMRPTPESIATLCNGYHVVARKLSE